MEHGLQDKPGQNNSNSSMEMPANPPVKQPGSTVMGMDYNYWTINGKSFPDTQPIEVKEGELVRIRLANISNGIHPMHLHGHDFRSLRKTVIRFPPRKSSVLSPSIRVKYTTSTSLPIIPGVS